MKLSQVLEGIETLQPISQDVDVTDITCDSRVAKQGYIFAAIKGLTVDRLDFVPDVVKAGAVAILSDRPVETSVPVILVKNVRLAFGLIASHLFPSPNLKKLAITGTNGKTSSVFFTQQLLNKVGILTASMGTVGVNSPVWQENTTMTTADPDSLNKNFQKLQEKGVQVVCIEASSIGIEQDRIAGNIFEGGAFTNLTQDHLDLHKTMRNYLNAKKKLFDFVKADGVAVLNADIPEFQELKEYAQSKKLRLFTYGKNGTEAKLLSQEPTAKGQLLQLEVLGKKYTLQFPVIGDFQAYNLLDVLGLCYAAGADLKEIIPLAETLKAPDGRSEWVAEYNQGQIYVDYAHTPDALERLLISLRKHTTGRLICLFGCGGNRDNTKRPIMGEIANRLADVVYVTDDNPRDEDPASIRQMILQTCPKGIEVDNRVNAIHTAIDALQPDDLLVLAGKGHEDYQLIKGVKHHLYEKEEILNYLKTKQ